MAALATPPTSPSLTPSVTAALATSPSSPSPPPASPIESPALSAPTPPVTPPVTPLVTTPRKPISRAEVASGPKSPSAMPSRLPRPTVKYGLPTPPLSPILQPQESTNSITKPPFTSLMKHLTVEDLYQRFHGKSKPTSLAAIRNRPSPALPSGMPSGQMRITSYFKRAGSTVELASARKYVDSRAPGQAVKNGDLALSRPVAGYVQQSIVSDMPHKHSDHCSTGIKGWSRADSSLSRHAMPPPTLTGHTQRFIVSDKLHGQFSHCSRGTKRWSCADSSSSKRTPIAENPARHICRRCTQHFTSGNMLHRLLPHCSPCINRWPSAVNGFYPPPSLHQ